MRSTKGHAQCSAREEMATGKPTLLEGSGRSSHATCHDRKESTHASHGNGERGCDPDPAGVSRVLGRATGRLAGGRGAAGGERRAGGRAEGLLAEGDGRRGNRCGSRAERGAEEGGGHGKVRLQWIGRGLDGGRRESGLGGRGCSAQAAAAAAAAAGLACGARNGARSRSY
jgi:hypothetical protein